MLTGRWRGQKIGSGTGVWKMSEMVRAGEMSQDDFVEAESCMHRSKGGSCMTMGTASTMANMVEALGMSLPENAAIPAVDSRRYRLAQLSGRRIVQMVHEDMRMSKIMTRNAFENAICANAAIGGSTNAVIHLLAMAGRLGVPLTLQDWDDLGSKLPCLVNLQPSGEHLMEDYYYAGGLPAVLREISAHLHLGALTVNGKTLGENVASAPCWNRDVIMTTSEPFKPEAGIAVLRGNLAPDGAVIKQTAASPELLRHTGKAYVFENYEQMRAQIDSPDLPVDASTVLVMQNCGPKGAPGFSSRGLKPRSIESPAPVMTRRSEKCGRRASRCHVRQACSQPACWMNQSCKPAASVRTRKRQARAVMIRRATSSVAGHRAPAGWPATTTARPPRAGPRAG